MPMPASPPAQDLQAEPALFRLHLSRALGPEYVPFVADCVRMLCIQATIQLMMTMSASPGSTVAFFSPDFVLLILYVLLGVMLYWLAVRRLVAIV